MGKALQDWEKGLLEVGFWWAWETHVSAVSATRSFAFWQAPDNQKQVLHKFNALFSPG